LARVVKIKNAVKLQAIIEELAIRIGTDIFQYGNM
jgi:hypothetical protein